MLIVCNTVNPLMLMVQMGAVKFYMRLDISSLHVKGVHEYFPEKVCILGKLDY